MAMLWSLGKSDERWRRREAHGELAGGVDDGGKRAHAHLDHGGNNEVVRRDAGVEHSDEPCEHPSVQTRAAPEPDDGSPHEGVPVPLRERTEG